MGQQGKNKMLNREFVQGLQLQLAAGRRLTEREECNDILKKTTHAFTRSAQIHFVSECHSVLIES